MEKILGQTGFSVDNLYFMKRWYAFYRSSKEIESLFARLGRLVPELC